MAKFCMYCGAALAPGAKTCAACGRPVAQLPGFAPESGAAQGPRPDDAAREALTPAPPKAVFAAEGALAPAAAQEKGAPPASAAQNDAPEGPAAEKAAPGARPDEPAKEEANTGPAPRAPLAQTPPAPTPVPQPSAPQTAIDEACAQLDAAKPAPVPAPAEPPAHGAQTPPPAGETPAEQPKYAPVGPALRPSAQGAGITTGGVLSMLVLALLPVAGWVLMLVWAFDSQSSEARRCVAKGILLFKLIALALVLVLLLALAALGWQAFAWGPGYGGPHRYW
ncbi:MAG TPA: hypothetical protein H9883_02760 [Candidatus Ruthenibacterium merdigallinarum]|nr:hypothetical protein [Candidatus Ruthenibacterium merdigallinarum]